MEAVHNTFYFAIIAIEEHWDYEVERPTICHNIKLRLDIHYLLNNVLDIVQLDVLPILL